MLLPLHAFWRLEAASLPERLRARERADGFLLPGADALADFSALLGDTPQSAPADETQSVPFALPGLLPEDVTGEASLSRAIDFGALQGERAVLEFDALFGSGDILLGGRRVASFGGPRTPCAQSDLTCAPCAMAVDLTDALRRARRELLQIRFDASRPAGLPGPIALRVTRDAHLCSAVLLPDPRKKAMTLRAGIAAGRDGTYVLTAQPIVPGEQGAPAWETRAAFAAGQTQTLTLRMDVPGSPFRPGQSYDASAMKILLWRASAQTGGPRDPGYGVSPCDGVTLLCGYSGGRQSAYLPLTAAECALAPDMLIQRLRDMHVCSVLMPVPGSDALYRGLTRAGIAVLQRTLDDDSLRARLARFPCVTFEEEPDALDIALPLAVSAWRLAGMTAFLRVPDPGTAPGELLAEAAGRAVDPEDTGVRDVLLWLRALSVRLTAEAARQGRARGALCAPGEWDTPDVAEALRTALAPLHLSALPLYGAWWTGTRFSASLHVFVPADASPAEGGAALRAEAVLETESGQALAHTECSCPPSGGYAGLLEAALPASPCVLTLTTRLTRGDEVLEENALPVYVGERGPLEAAFQPG